MTDTETLAAAALGGGGVLGFLKWCVTQWIESKRLDRLERAADREALIRDTEAKTILAGKVDALAGKFTGLESKLDKMADHFDEISERSGVYDVPRPKKRRAATEPMGAPVVEIEQPITQYHVQGERKK